MHWIVGQSMWEKKFRSLFCQPCLSWSSIHLWLLLRICNEYYMKRREQHTTRPLYRIWGDHNKLTWMCTSCHIMLLLFIISLYLLFYLFFNLLLSFLFVVLICSIFPQGWESSSTDFHSSHVNLSGFHVQVDGVLVRSNNSPLLILFMHGYLLLLTSFWIIRSLSPAINALQERLKENEIRVWYKTKYGRL